MALDTSKVSNRVWHAGPLHKLKSYGISSRLFGHISSFLSSKRFQVVLDESLHKSIKLMLEFLKASFLVLQFPYYALMTFLMMLPEILLSVLMILNSTLNVIRHLICGKI